ncbi:hypothetical protein PR048_012443 [Dryococelus australis]|uniref:Uncharacterized protein n=1 Tax=Dryococelus australis TaxID=614101 RepID=A0ABQ9HPF6_9NEOP|nr:hypothetical protein PR048_012443 [Dryococelus australis]
MVFSKDQRVFIVEHNFTTLLYARVADAFCLRYLDTAVPNNAKIIKWISCRQEEIRETGDFDGGLTGCCRENYVVVTFKKSAEIVPLNEAFCTEKLHLRAYHVRCVQELKGRDKYKCLVYWFRSFFDYHGIVLLDKVFFTDEAWFHLSGYVNNQNSRIWSFANPHVLHEKLLHCQKIGVWCAVSRPPFYRSNSEVYQDIVTQFIVLLDIYERDCWFQHDCATCHTLNATMQFLRKFFGDHFILAGL